MRIVALVAAATADQVQPQGQKGEPGQRRDTRAESAAARAAGVDGAWGWLGAR